MEFFNKKNRPPEDQPKEFWRIKEWFPDLPTEAEQKLKIFHTELIKFNGALNLVSEKTLVMADVIHFADCILASREIAREAQPSSITDISLGNGLPGIVIAALYPSIKVTILNKDARKIEFMKHVCTLLKLGNVEFQAVSLESIPPGSLGRLVTRGFAPISKAILTLRKQVKKGGELYMMKSEEWPTEVANIPSQLCTFWVPSLVGEYRLPIGEVKFAVVKLKKIAD